MLVIIKVVGDMVAAVAVGAPVVYLAVFLAGMVASVQYDCSSGCALNPAIAGPPVQGNDGQVYMNACLATCQGVSFWKREGTLNSHLDTSGAVTEEDIFRYNEDGFRLVSKRLSTARSDVDEIRTYSDNNAVGISEFENEEDESSKDDESSKEETVIHARRISYKDGLEYVTAYNTSELAISSREEYLPSLLRPTPRNVIGKDERSIITNTTVFPYSAVGQLEFGGGRFCSGTVISRNAFLTAAHCIYDVENEDWFELKRFVPGRFRSDDIIEDPFGEWYPTSATVYQTYMYAKTRNDHYTYDYAVVLLAPREDQCTFIGDVVGFVGLRKTELGEQRLNDASINGYPEDMPYGSMWTTGNCRGDAFGCLGIDHYACYYCDSAGGMSGGAKLDPENYAIGTHANWFKRFDKPIYNGGTIIDTDWRLQNTIDWSQRGVQLPVCDVQNKTVPTESGRAQIISTPSSEIYNYCFSGRTEVEVKGKGILALHALRIGDLVLAGNGQYAYVYSFAHLDRERVAEFLQLKLAGEREDALEVTAGHLLFVNRGGRVQAQAASSLRVGDNLLDKSGSAVRIVEIDTVTRRGIFAPFTTTGDIVVNGVLASSYATFDGRDDLPTKVPYQWLAHVLIAPRRIFCHSGLCEDETYTDEGIASWLSFYYWIIQQHSGLQILFFFALAPFVLSIYLLEKFILWKFALASFVAGSTVFNLIWGLERERLMLSKPSG